MLNHFKSDKSRLRVHANLLDLGHGNNDKDAMLLTNPPMALVFITVRYHEQAAHGWPLETVTGVTNTRGVKLGDVYLEAYEFPKLNGRGAAEIKEVLVDE